MIKSIIEIKDKATAQKILERIQATEVNVLLIGGTGVGKSSTISALFQWHGNNHESKAKVGQSSKSETMDISSHKLNNIVIWDTPGLGDSTDKDKEHKCNIIKLLKKNDDHKQPLIDLVLLILDASNKDFSSAYTLIKDVVLPSLQGVDRRRLLIGINQADMALKGRHWNAEKNKPEPQLVERLDEQVRTVKARIKADTGLDVEPIYYSAGYKDGDDLQHPYNLQKLLSFILERLPEKKRASIAEHINSDKENFLFNDGKENYDQKIEKSIISSIAIYFKEIITETSEKIKDFATDPKVIKATSEFITTAAINLLKNFMKK